MDEQELQALRRSKKQELEALRQRLAPVQEIYAMRAEVLALQAQLDVYERERIKAAENAVSAAIQGEAAAAVSAAERIVGAKE